jgi:hypothetical protein
VRPPSIIAHISRQRRVKCDGVRPVCGRCLKSNRQCLGFEEPNRLILKDETETVIKRFSKKPRTASKEAGTSPESETDTTMACGDAHSPKSTMTSPIWGSGMDLEPIRQPNEVPYGAVGTSTEWFPIRTVDMIPAYEQNQVALYCCRETVSLRTLSWIMSDDKWIELLPQMMERSDTLKAIIHANAAVYLAKVSGATSTPRQALAHYAYALRDLQLDLYDPVRQRTDETLFAIILLAIFDVDPRLMYVTRRFTIVKILVPGKHTFGGRPDLLNAMDQSTTNQKAHNRGLLQNMSVVSKLSAP